MNITPYLSQQPVDDFGLLFSKIHYSSTLGASADTALTVPSTAPRFKALIKVRSGVNVWVALNEAATVPAGNTFLATPSELINGTLCREVKAGDVLHFITATASTDVSVVFYSVGTNN